MNIRRDPIYISTEVGRALWLLAKSEKVHPTGEHGDNKTADEIADDILRQAIREQHPQIFEHQKKIESMEKELIKSL